MTLFVETLNRHNNRNNMTITQSQRISKVQEMTRRCLYVLMFQLICSVYFLEIQVENAVDDLAMRSSFIVPYLSNEDISPARICK